METAYESVFGSRERSRTWKRGALLGLLVLAFTAVNFLTLANVAWAAPADLDPSFDGDGKTITNFNARCAGDFATDAVIQSDGKIIVAGSAGDCLDGRASAIARYNADGSLDNSFGSGGKVVTAFYAFGNGDAYVSDVALQPDGKIVVAVYSNSETIVARYNSDGSPDNAFGDQGQARGTGWGASAVAVREDGKIVVAGIRSTGSGYEFLLSDYNADGSPDTGFGINGQQSTAFGSGNGFTGAYDLALQEDGKIVVVGRANGDAIVGDDDFFAVARYNPDGSLDPSFDGDGKLTTSTSPGSDGASSVAIQEDGKIVVGGYSYDLTDRKHRGSLARYNTDGSLDTSFGENGTLTSPVLDNIVDLAVQTDGKIVAPGTRENTFVVARYGADGSPDATFGNGGSTSTNFYGGAYGGAASVAIQGDGKIVAAGRSYGGADLGFAVARYAGGNEKVAPTTTVMLSQQPNENGWNNENLTVTLSASDGENGSGVKEIVYNAGQGTQVVQGDSVEIPITREGHTGIAYQARDNAGNQEEYTTYQVKLDKTKPDVNCGTSDGLWHAQDASIACTATDELSGLSDAADAGFTLSTNVPLDTETTNARTNSRQVSDAAGNAATAGPIAGIKVDKKDPSVSCGAADALWHKEDVSIACTASDNGSGLANASDANFSLSTSVAANTETADAQTDRREIPDAVGNTEVAGPISGNKVDKKAPEISVSTPAEGAEYALDAAVASDYACTDGGSGVGSCAGPVAGGANINTSSVGQKTFNVDATDKVGNAATLSRGYTVRDNALPKTTISSGPAGLTNDRTPTFGFGGSDNVTPEAEMLFSYKVDGGEWSAYSPERSATLGGVAGLSEGAHTFYVKAKDTAGNEDPFPAERRFTVDSVKPRGTVKINGGTATTRNLKVRLALSATDPSLGSGVSSVRISNDGRRWSGWQPYTKSKAWRLKVGKAGMRVVYVQYRDRAGNVSATARDTIRYRR